MYLLYFHIIVFAVIFLLMIKMASCKGKLTEIKESINKINNDSLNKVNLQRYLLIFKSISSIFKKMGNSNIILYKFGVDKQDVKLDFALQIRQIKGKILPFFSQSLEDELIIKSILNVKHTDKKFIKGDTVYIDDIKNIEKCHPYTYTVLKKFNIKSYYTITLFKDKIPVGVMIVAFKKAKVLEEYEISFFRRVSKIIGLLF